MVVKNNYFDCSSVIVVPFRPRRVSVEHDPVMSDGVGPPKPLLNNDKQKVWGGPSLSDMSVI